MADIRIKDLEVGQNYSFQIRAKTANGKTSAWSTIFDMQTTTDIIAPKPVTGLTWVVSESSFVAEWIAPTENSNDTELHDLKDYKITLTANSQSIVYYVSQEIFNLTFEMNSAGFGSAQPTVQISVQARDLTGNLSTPVSLTASNPIPADVTGLQLQPTLGGINVRWTKSDDSDFKRYELYSSTTSSSFTPNSGNLRYSGTGNAFLYTIGNTSTVYFKLRAIDIFEQPSANYASDSSAAYPIDGVPDTTAPSQPSAPIISISTLSAQVSHAMTKQAGGNLESDVDYLEVHASSTTGFTPSDSTLLGTINSAGPGIPVSAAFYFPTTDALLSLYWKVIAVDKSKNKSTQSNQTSGLPGLIESANILNATITDAKIQNLSAAKLIAGTAIINDLFIEANLTLSDVGVIQSENFVPGTTGWSINAAGLAEFNDVTVRGELFVDGANGFEYLRVYPLNGVPTMEWLSESGQVWESYAVDDVDTSFLKIESPNGGGIRWVADKGVALTGVNLGNDGILFDKTDRFLRFGYVPTFTPTGWETATLQAGYTSLASWSVPKYMLMPDGTVMIKGGVTPGTLTDATTIFTLPTGYRPLDNHIMMVSAPGASSVNQPRIFINPAGSVQVFGMAGATAIRLSGIRFPVI